MKPITPRPVPTTLGEFAAEYKRFNNAHAECLKLAGSRAKPDRDRLAELRASMAEAVERLPRSRVHLLASPGANAIFAKVAEWEEVLRLDELGMEAR